MSERSFADPIEKVDQSFRDTLSPRTSVAERSLARTATVLAVVAIITSVVAIVLATI